jgi:light-regulated signal transduction histidine kinase (bacteriophytochrome)
MQLTLPFKALTTQLHRVKTNSISAEYQKWRQRFLLERLHLAVAISLIVYLSRQIIKAHGGEIGVHSRPGEGATFWFTLPLAVLKIG